MNTEQLKENLLPFVDEYYATKRINNSDKIDGACNVAIQFAIDVLTSVKDAPQKIRDTMNHLQKSLLKS